MTGSKTTALSQPVFTAVRDLAYRTAGIDLQPGKQEMVAARLWKRASALGFDSAEAYFRAVQTDRSGKLEVDLIDALTTNHTSFFREPAHFDFLRTHILPKLRTRLNFTIWSAASSSGEEPYSIAVTLLEELGSSAARIAKVRASDISTAVLRRAEAGVYPEDKFRDLGHGWCSRYLLRGTGSQVGNFRMRPELRRMIHFERINLMDPLTADGAFPLIFLRNVMIYFDRPAQERVIASLTAMLEPGGYLFVGHSESLNGLAHGLEYVQVAVYRKPGDLKAGA